MSSCVSCCGQPLFCFVMCSLPKDVNIFMIDLHNDGCCSVEKLLELLKLASKRLDHAQEITFTYNIHFPCTNLIASHTMCFCCTASSAIIAYCDVEAQPAITIYMCQLGLFCHHSWYYARNQPRGVKTFVDVSFLASHFV